MGMGILPNGKLIVTENKSAATKDGYPLQFQYWSYKDASFNSKSYVTLTKISDIVQNNFNLVRMTRLYTTRSSTSKTHIFALQNNTDYIICYGKHDKGFYPIVPMFIKKEASTSNIIFFSESRGVSAGGAVTLYTSGGVYNCQVSIYYQGEIYICEYSVLGSVISADVDITGGGITPGS